ncbi:hypothetical protein CBM2629_A170041 [Cupriavidus taiwanensis]|nr:hypothetical protein CBM2629_A170041 [Cupriavidus taiwanensis]
MERRHVIPSDLAYPLALRSEGDVAETKQCLRQTRQAIVESRELLAEIRGRLDAERRIGWHRR